MASAGKTYDDTDLYPVFASKQATFRGLYDAIKRDNITVGPAMREFIYRLTNTNTSTFADPTYDHTSLGLL